jgi:hypothetical protein
LKNFTLERQGESKIFLNDLKAKMFWFLVRMKELRSSLMTVRPKS